ncbi:MAG: cytochrome b/b6 domain-containing protein [Armatimonadota bacterium]|nr:cytochrome b/b6 domain-containing protein [Armatimonadota bacterium]
MGRKGSARRASTAEIQRFSLGRRIEHFLLMISVNVLAFTGLPQKYFYTGWGQRIIQLLGGIEQTRFIHRTFALVLVGVSVYHLGTLLWQVLRGVSGSPPMALTMKDFRDMVDDFRYLLGFTKERPRYDRFDYQQKLDYWFVVWGTTIFIITGFIMWFPEWISRYLPGIVIPAARVAHGGEALLAVYAVILWHFYAAHFRPQVFPFDPAMWTGKITLKRLREEHPLEYERIIKTLGTPRDAEAQTAVCSEENEGPPGPV